MAEERRDNRNQNTCRVISWTVARCDYSVVYFTVHSHLLFKHTHILAPEMLSKPYCGFNPNRNEAEGV